MPGGTPEAALRPCGVDEPSAAQLLWRARRLLWMTLVPLLLMVLVLAAWQARVQWQKVLGDALAQTRQHAEAFETLARDAEDHVTNLQAWLQHEYLRADTVPSPATADALRPRFVDEGQVDGHTLDDLPEALRPGQAQLLWSRPDGAAPDAATLYRTESLSTVLEIAHQRRVVYARSYYAAWPERSLLLYPWVPSQLLLDETGQPTLASALEAWSRRPVTQLAQPERNPTRQAQWTAPTPDADGRGLVVSRAAPVVVADEPRGVVGTDIRLDALQSLLERLPGGPWQAWVVDDAGHVLADRQQGQPATARAPLLAERLPAALTAEALQRIGRAGGQVAAAGDQRVVALSLARVPWTLVLAAPGGDLLMAMLPEVLPYTLIVFGVVLVWLGGELLLRVRVVEPLLHVFEYLQQASADAATPEPQLGRRWQPWVRMVTRTFASMRGAMQAEQRAEALKSAIVDHALAAVVVVDADDVIVEFNPAAETMLGLTRQQALGRTVAETICPVRHRDSYRLLRQRLQQGDPDRLLGQRIERMALCADGRELPVEVVLWMTRVGDAAYFTASMTDRSRARADAEVIARQREALRQSEKLTAMGGLLAGVAHELNNPLAIVVGRASLLEDRTEGTPLQADATRIREAAERCGRIVRTFLDMARSRPARHAPVQVNDLVRAAADLLGYTLRSHGVELDLRLAPGLPQVQADGDQVGQVVLNLLVNAQQALAPCPAPRRITVQTGCRDVGAGGAGGDLWLRVADNGPGVPEALRQDLFNPFFTTKAEGHGTGLGLSVSRSIAREHGGDLELEPAGPGASFLLHLPRPVAATDTAQPEALDA